ncbi:facilitated trehalose transporter Tret1-like [Tribolium madens]|uniref:facilitated trehalose transporter Tret1-like n=1 Tax=Tribolium madens TaxID=41895 RepID=UPI001CF73781|nr:facilitated trehalose transporter Tret1-like [Tribolium madens]
MQETPLEEIIYKAPDDSPTTLKLTKKPQFNFYLYLVAAIANLLGFSTGTAIVWVAPVLPKLLSSKNLQDSPLGRIITHSEGAWIAGLLPLGAIFGPFLAGKIADKIGRKKSLIGLALIKVVSLLITAYATSISLYYVSRFMIGVAIGTIFAVLPMYLAEIAENHNRGTLACSMGVFIAIGFNFTFLLGPYLTVQNFCLVCLTPLVVFVPSFLILCPETPVFLAVKHERGKLVKSLQKIRNDNFEPELTLLEASQQSQQVTSGIKTLLKTKSLRKGLIISLGLISLQQSAGVSAIMSYLQTIFEATGSKFAPEICAMIIGSFQVVGTLLASTIVDKAGRKILLLCSSAGMSITLLLLALYFYLQGYKFAIVAKLSWLPVLSLVVFVLSFSFGLGPVPWAVMAEIFPANVRSLAASLTSITCFINTFVVTVTFPSMALFFGMSNCFLIFAAICMAGTFFIYKVLPETKGRSLQEIQKLLEGQK